MGRERRNNSHISPPHSPQIGFYSKLGFRLHSQCLSFSPNWIEGQHLYRNRENTSHSSEQEFNSMTYASLAPLSSSSDTNLHLRPNHLSKATKLWIVVSVLIILLVIASVAIYCYIKVRREQQRRQQQQQQLQQQQQQLGIEVVAALPRRILDHTAGQTDCSICLEDFEEQEELVELPGCLHLFHRGCIEPWLRDHGECPNCRRGV